MSKHMYYMWTKDPAEFYWGGIVHGDERLKSDGRPIRFASEQIYLGMRHPFDRSAEKYICTSEAISTFSARIKMRPLKRIQI